MGETYRSGVASLTVEQSAVVRLLDRASDGAASSFIRRSQAAQDKVRGDARDRWPVRTGRSRDAFTGRVSVTERQIAVQLINPATGPRGPYAYALRWSVRTAESLTAEVEAAAARGTTPEAQRTIRELMRRRLTARHGAGAPSESLAGRSPWAVLVRAPGRKAADDMLPELQRDLSALAGGR